MRCKECDSFLSADGSCAYCKPVILKKGDVAIRTDRSVALSVYIVFMMLSNIIMLVVAFFAIHHQAIGISIALVLEVILIVALFTQVWRMRKWAAVSFVVLECLSLILALLRNGITVLFVIRAIALVFIFKKEWEWFY